MTPRKSRRRSIAVLSVAAVAAVSFFAAPSATAVSPPATHSKVGVSAERSDPLPGAPLADPAEMARPEVEPAPPLGKKSGEVQVAKKAITTLAATDSVALRPLVIATDESDFGLETWRSVLDSIGTPYDVLLAVDDPLAASDLVRTDGAGKYSAVLLTNNALLYQDAEGNYFSAFDGTEWNTLWDYERTFKVRQVSLYTSYGTFPEDYCLRPGSEGSIGDTPVQTSLTATGASFFETLKATAQIPISLSYVYRSTIEPGCAAQPLLTAGSDVLGVVTTSTDGRERAALTFSSNQYLPQADLLGYGLVNWATKGVFIGEQRHWINVDEDDWFNSGDHLYPDGTLETDPGFRLSGPEVSQINNQQTAFRNKYPLANTFTLNMAYNAGDFDARAHAMCTSLLSRDPLSSYSRCLRNRFRWVNHTLTHPEMNFTTYAQSVAEIRDNLTKVRNRGFTVPTEVLKTGEYSGLGVYNPDPNAPDTDPPTDFGLGASNPNLLKAAKDLGVKYLHGNMSFESHKPDCFNCGIVHPMEPALMVVPDWPTNIGYHTTTPAEQTYLFNTLYGPTGKFPFFDHNLTYAEVVDYESGVALQHVMDGSAYTHTLHVGNLHQYASGKSLTFDWLNAILDKYSSYYKVPLRNPDWVGLASYVSSRTAHTAEYEQGNDALWNRVTNQVTYQAARTGSLFVTGVTGGGSQTEVYGADNISRVGLTAGNTVTLTATPR